MKERRINRNLVLLAGFIFNFCLSGTSAFSIFVNPMMSLTGWEQGSITMAYTIYNIMICIFGIVIGVIGSKIKVRKLMYFGSIMFAVGWMITGFANNIWIMYLGFGVIAGIGGGCLYNFSVTNTLKWFPDKKGFTSGLLLGGAAIGPVFTAPVATAILESQGVLASYKIMGIIYLVLMFAVGWLVHTPQPDYKPEGWNPVSSESTVIAKDYTWKEMMATKTFYLLYFVFIFACTSTMMMLGAVASIGQDQAGMTASMASLAVSLLAVSNFSGRMFFGSISDKFGRYKTLLLAMALNFIAMITLSNMTTPISFMVVMCIVGACGGALLVMFPPITAECFGTKNSGLNYAIMFSAYSIAALLGPQLVSYYQKTMNSYSPAFIWAAGLTIVAAILLLTVMNIRKKEYQNKYQMEV